MVLYYDHAAAYSHATMFAGRHGGSSYGFSGLYGNSAGAQYDFHAPYSSASAAALTSDHHAQSAHQNSGPYFYDYRSAAAATNMDDHWAFPTPNSCNLSLNSSGSSQLSSSPYRTSPTVSHASDSYGPLSPISCNGFPGSQSYFSASFPHGNNSHLSASSSAIAAQFGLRTPTSPGDKVTIKSENSMSSPNAKSIKYDWPVKSGFQSHQSSTAPVSGKTRTKDKYRVVYSDHQRAELEKEFSRHKYIDVKRKTEIARALLLSERQVKIWFQNRRAKDRKQGRKKVEPSAPASRSGTQLPLHTSVAGIAYRAAVSQPFHERSYETMKMEG